MILYHNIKITFALHHTDSLKKHAFENKTFLILRDISTNPLII